MDDLFGAFPETAEVGTLLRDLRTESPPMTAAKASPSKHRRMSVGQMFTAVNWRNDPNFTNVAPTATPTETVSTRRMTVGALFAAVNWRNAALAKAAPVVEVEDSKAGQEHRIDGFFQEFQW